MYLLATKCIFSKSVKIVQLLHVICLSKALDLQKTIHLPFLKYIENLPFQRRNPDFTFFAIFCFLFHCKKSNIFFSHNSRRLAFLINGFLALDIQLQKLNKIGILKKMEKAKRQLLLIRLKRKTGPPLFLKVNYAGTIMNVYQ